MSKCKHEVEWFRDDWDEIVYACKKCGEDGQTVYEEVLAENEQLKAELAKFKLGLDE